MIAACFGALALLVVTMQAVTGGTFASLSAETKNPTNQFATTSLAQPVPTSVHTSAIGGMVTLSWSGYSAWTTGFQIQRSTSSTGPFTTLATITLGTSGFTEFTVPTASSQPGGIAWGPDGNLWFTEVAANKIAKMTPSGAFTEYTVPTAASQPTGITAGPDGNLWFTESAANKVAKVTTSGTFTEYALTTLGSAPAGITTGPDGNLWYAGPGKDKVGKVTTSGTVTEYNAEGGSAPTSVVAGSDGNVWATENLKGKLAQFTTGGTRTVFALPSGGSSLPKGVTSGPNGNLRVAEATANKIGKLTPSDSSVSESGTGITASSQPTGIAVGPDAKVWFTEYAGNRIASIDSSDTVVEYAIPTASSQPTGITAGPDGNIWFTEAGTNKIGRYGLNLSNTWTDATAAPNSQYYYQVVATYLSWTRASATDSALSLAPTAGTDTTGTGSVAISAANLTNLSTLDGNTFTTGTNWANTATWTSNNLKGVDMISPSQGWVVGATNTIMMTTNGGMDWAAQTAPNSNYEDVTATDATHAWAVGSGGVIAFYNGTSWAAQTSGTTQALKSVFALDTTHVWAIGASGTVLFYNGSSWAAQTSGTTNQLNGVSAVDATHVWAVGNSGTILFYNGTSWAVQTSGTTNNLNDVSSADASHAWAVGAAGTIRFYNGTSWAAQTSPTNQGLNYSFALDATHVWADGGQGTIAFYDGTSWALQNTTGGKTPALSGLDFADSVHGIAAGDGGLLFVTSDGGANWEYGLAQYVEMQASPTVASGGTISSVKATLTYKPSTNATSGTGFWLLVSGDGGGSWTFYPLTAALLSSTTVTSSVDISATINTVSKVQNMRLRFYIESVPGGTGFKTIHDFVHVDVN